MADLNPTHVAVISSRGAPLGRPSREAFDPTEKLRLHRVQIDSQGYDPGGAYWGVAHSTGPGFLYIAYSDTFVTYVRAWSREAAKAEVLRVEPRATFLR